MGNTNTNTKGTKGTTTTNTTTPVATFVAPPKVTPANRKGNSTLANPTAMVWVHCINLTIANGNLTPNRATLHNHCIAQGVTYYTVRTQVNRYLQWCKGTPNIVPPRGVQVPTGFAPTVSN